VDDGLRSRRFLLAALVALGPLAPLLLACGAGAAAEAIGASHGARSDSSSVPVVAVPGGSASPLSRDFRSTFTKLNRERFASRGHLRDRFDVDVYVNTAAKGAWESGAHEYPVGSVLVKDQFDHAVAGRAAGVLVMEKREAGYDPEGGDWRWLVLGLNGGIEREGKIDACIRCHADTVGDHVFAFVE
jgi:hypothetical protein